MSNQIYIPPINFNDFDVQTGSTTSINAIEPLEYNKLNSNLSIKVATENNYGVMTTGTQNIRGIKNFVDSISVPSAEVNNVSLTSGTITTSPTNDTDITNKKYIDDKILTADFVKYDTSTKYLTNNNTASNITDLKIDSLNVSDNYINKVPVSIMVRTRGSAGTFDKDITIYKIILNGKNSIVFNKNLDFNSYSNTTDASISKNSIILNMTNLSDIFGYLPYEFELTGETSTYGGTKNIATRTLKFKKSPADPYKYDLQYDQSFPFNIFKLKDTIKNTDTIISTSETQKINTLTIDKGYLYNTPTEANNLVNKSYVDSLVSTKVSESATELSDEFNGVISESINSINSVALTTGTISTTPSAANDIANKKYVDYSLIDFETVTNNKINAEIGEALSNLSTVNLTTGTISTAPTNDTDIANKKYVVDSIDEVKSELSNFITYDNSTYDFYKGNNKITTINTSSLYTGSTNTGFLTVKEKTTSKKAEIEELTATNTTTTNLISSDVKINNSLNLGSGIMEFQRFSMQTIYNSSSSGLASCVVVFLKIRIGNVIFINIKLNFSPFTSDGTTLYIKNLEISDIGANYGEYNTYLCISGESNFLKAGRCQFYILKNSNGTYNIEIRNTGNGDKICKFDDFECVYDIVES